MRKKSHISLANYLIKSMKFEDLQNHKKAFYIGSILPDCVPSFITRKHNIEETFEILRKEILKITDNYDIDRGFTGYYSRHLGVITHYIADYFTFPHNEIFTGSLKEHCSYEKDLKFAFKSYVLSDEAVIGREKSALFKTVDEILLFIKEMHEEYLKAIKVIKVDCMYIVELCHKVVDAILHIFETNFSDRLVVTA
ncbi:zinc dependent phospholipase C family protein [Anaerocolumna sp. AGMB13025]|uniref:zinc dependent phospholipase C family protein n=1 Tax=Anaerocolumna sp. AGMB13025 TaxID=3039116 RepID=UPI00241BF7FE|nr:zinc dependent phospholipase C family protein [Anaerocolumna sp. AGMB13025]WFR59560.1 zinc dependent phospholipase C family protein [Anaerocolumna sp. AGMB13025]